MLSELSKITSLKSDPLDVLLFAVGLRLSQLAATGHPKFKSLLDNRNFTIQMGSEAEDYYRYFSVSNGQFAQHAGKAPEPTLAITFKDSMTGAKLLTKGDATAFMVGIQNGDLKMTGDYSLLMWFNQVAKFIVPKVPEPLQPVVEQAKPLLEKALPIAKDVFGKLTALLGGASVSSAKTDTAKTSKYFDGKTVNDDNNSGADNNGKPTDKDQEASTLDNLKHKATELKEELTDKVSELKAEASEKLAEVKTDVQEKVETLKADAEEKLEEVKTIAKDKLDEVKDKASEVKTEAKDKLDDVKADVKDKVEEVKDKAADVKIEAKDKLDDVKADVKDKVEEVKDKAADVKTEAKDKLDDVKADVKDKVDEVKDKAADAKTEAKDKLDGVKADVKDKVDEIQDKATKSTEETLTPAQKKSLEMEAKHADDEVIADHVVTKAVKDDKSPITDITITRSDDKKK